VTGVIGFGFPVTHGGNHELSKIPVSVASIPHKSPLQAGPLTA